MTSQHVPASDVRRHFLITGTYVADGYVPTVDLTHGVEKALTRAFAEPQHIMAYNTPRFHHPYAVDLREQYINLKKEQIEELTQRFPALMTSLITFLQGGFNT
jgi:hypothetical protein